MSAQIFDTVQLFIFMRVIDKEFNVYEDLVDMCNIKATTTCERIFKNIENSIRKIMALVEKMNKCYY